MLCIYLHANHLLNNVEANFIIKIKGNKIYINLAEEDVKNISKMLNGLIRWEIFRNFGLCANNFFVIMNTIPKLDPLNDSFGKFSSSQTVS